MSKFKLEFTLKQHTPLIHFQSDQSGATLRATELKPKFDRFLIEQLSLTEMIKKDNKDVEVPKDNYKHWFIGKGKKHLALDYKVKISTIGTINRSLPNRFMFFANNVIKDNRDKKYMVKASSIKVEFFSFNTIIMEYIKNFFEEFMLITNFGARSTKGYGSFSLFKKSSKNIETILKKYYPIVFKVINPNINRWETTVDTLHKKLKSGINFKSYYKSLLFQYMCTRRIRWEKRKIKQEFPQLAQSKNGHAPIDCNQQFNFRYIRAMLGLAGINEYQGEQVVTITHKEKEIDRFASPIIYKIIDNNIYLLGNRSYEKIMDKTFIFALKEEEFEIKTPSQEEFDLYDFLKFVEKQENLISEVNQ